MVMADVVKETPGTAHAARISPAAQDPVRTTTRNKNCRVVISSALNPLVRVTISGGAQSRYPWTLLLPQTNG